MSYNYQVRVSLYHSSDLSLKIIPGRQQQVLMADGLSMIKSLKSKLISLVYVGWGYMLLSNSFLDT